MERTLENNKLIAQFMGWEVVKNPILDEYPTQQWLTTRQKDTKNWDSSLCVWLGKPETEQELETTTQKLWNSLCNTEYGRVSMKDWNSLMKVVKEIDCKLYNMNMEYIEGDVSLDSFYSQNIEGLSYNSEDGAMISMDIEIAYKAVVKFIEWFNAEKEAGYEPTCPYPTNWMECPTWNKSEFGCFNCPLYKKNK